MDETPTTWDFLGGWNQGSTCIARNASLLERASYCRSFGLVGDEGAWKTHVRTQEPNLAFLYIKPQAASPEVEHHIRTSSTLCVIIEQHLSSLNK
eukprot:3677125-Amphidinium_carterae.1